MQLLFGDLPDHDREEPRMFKTIVEEKDVYSNLAHVPTPPGVLTVDTNISQAQNL